MPVIGGIAGGILALRSAFALGSAGPVASTFFKSPIIQGGAFGVGYTGGAYAGYGVSNTWDPLGLHKPKYSPKSTNIVPYGSYGRRRYSNYGRSRSYGGYSGYTRYRRYRRRPNYYRRSYY